MDKIIPRLLQFDRFAVDLTRGCLRIGNRNVDLRPKAFDVLCHLAENAGRLVTKQELLEAVWANVAVGDDSLVQCIRELREILGDDDHRLIKTVPRRGYLLDAAPTAAPQQWPLVENAQPERRDPQPMRPDQPGRVLRSRNRVRNFYIWVGAAACTLLLGTAWAVGIVRPAAPLASASALFTPDVAKRIAEIAERKGLPLPLFQMRQPARDLAPNPRRFVGVWVSDKGWLVSGRQLMLIVAQVDRDGTAVAYASIGPPQPRSHDQLPPSAMLVNARISDDTLSFDDEGDVTVAVLSEQNRIELRKAFRDGSVGAVALDPVWTQVGAEQAASLVSVAR